MNPDFGSSGQVSIVTPIFLTNLEYFRSCADSVRRVLERDAKKLIKEWIVVADGDPRDLRSILSSTLAGLSVKLKHVELPKNVGLSAARNAGVLVAQSDYITWLDADDTLRADPFLRFIDAGLRTFGAHDDVLMVISDNFDTDADLSPLFLRDKAWIVQQHQINVKTPLDPLLYVDFVYQCQLIRRDDVQAIGGFSVGQFGEDVDLILRLYAAWPDRRMYHVPEVAYNYRANPDGIVHACRSDLRIQNLRDYCRARSNLLHDTVPLAFLESRQCNKCVDKHLRVIANESLTAFLNCFIPEQATEYGILHGCS